MVSLLDLWLPILLSAVLVFLASSVIHMALRWHASDFNKLTAEDAVMDALRPFNLGPGDYAAPLPESMGHMSSAEFKAKQARGPLFTLTVLSGDSIGRNLATWFVYCIVVSVFAAYVAVLVWAVIGIALKHSAVAAVSMTAWGVAAVLGIAAVVAAISRARQITTAKS